MAAEATRSSPSPDSYIGSLISLTSKSEIRYEGILYNINTEESSIGLRNVRSFGTEGRKDGQQLPASDKIYEFILFRGSDIKDLQVKASPPSQTAPLQTDPAIIQSHYSHPSTASPSLPENYAPLGNVSAPVLGPNTTHLGFQNSSFQGSLPTYPTGGSYGPWSATPSPPMANVSGLAAPIYWQGYYANSGGVPQMRQSSLNRPPPGLAMPPIQQGLPFQNANAPLLSGFSNYPEFPPMLQGENTSLSSGSSNYPEFSSLFQPVSNNLSLTSTSMSSAVAPNQVTSLVPEGPPFSVSNKVPTTSLPMLVSSVNLPPVSSVAQGMEKSASLPQNMQSAGVSSKPRTVPSSVLDQVQSRSNLLVSSSSSKQTEAPINLVTPDQLIQPSLSTGPSSQSQVKIPNEADVKPPKDRTNPLLSEPPASAPEDKAKSKSAPVSKGPILPLPLPAYHKTSGDILHTTQNTRGRGRGRGNEHLQSAAKFPGEFDFAAMNEKFNKDEVWGSLSKNKAHSNYTEEEDEAYDFYEESADSKHVDAKPVYVKDDFFDTLSSNSNQQTSNGRIRFSEQLKIDTETFGNFVRNRSTYGGRGPRGGGGRGRGRSSHPGRGYGYAASGRYH